VCLHFCTINTTNNTANLTGKIGTAMASREDDDACLYAMHVSTSHIFPMVLTAAIELNLFDIIASTLRANRDAYVSTSEIASQLPTKNPDAPSLLDRMLRLLATYSLLTCSVRTYEDGRVERLYGISPAGKFYVQNEDGGHLASMALINSPGNSAGVWYVCVYIYIYTIVFH
jgi:caffeic acid 3-O-methyltransferase